MPNHNSTLLRGKDQKTPQDLVRGIVYQIRRLMQAGELYTKELSKTHQVSAPQLHCLLALYEHGPLPPSQIARHIMVKSSTVTGIIDRLEQKGLVTRLRNSPDRRVINIELTETGMRLAQNAPLPSSIRSWMASKSPLKGRSNRSSWVCPS
jgi:DNA-binding MarR family transcriptional regulator